MYKSHVCSLCRQWGLQETHLVIKPRGGRGDRFTGTQLDELCTQMVYTFSFLCFVLWVFFAMNDQKTHDMTRSICGD